MIEALPSLTPSMFILLQSAGFEAFDEMNVLRLSGLGQATAATEPKAVDLFRFFWREIKLIGARVYEPLDFDEAIALAASGNLPLEQMITQISPLAAAQEVFETIDKNPAGMKYLLEIA